MTAAAPPRTWTRHKEWQGCACVTAEEGGMTAAPPPCTWTRRCLPICFEALSKARMQARPIGSPYALSTLGGVVICDCGHGFCESCLTQYVRIAICEGRTRLGTLRCPMDHCTVPTQESLLEALAPLLIGRSICSIIERARLRRCLHCVSARSPIVTGLRYSPI